MPDMVKADIKANLPDAWKPFAEPVVTDDQLALIKRTIAQNATPDELKLYLYDCRRQGVHPLDTLLHFTKRGGKYTPVTSIDLMRIRASETNEYAGSDDAVFQLDRGGNLSIESASVTVWRLVQGQRCAFTATARWSEYYPGDQSGHMWKKMPHTMLAKCAEALALRKGFPRQLAGLYAREELDQANGGDSVKSTTITAAPPDIVVDTSTGAEVPASDKPTPPVGYRYIDGYNLDSGGWHHVIFMHYEADGSAAEFKTKLGHVGNVAQNAFQMGVPVKFTTAGVLLKTIEQWKPEGRKLPVLESEIF